MMNNHLKALRLRRLMTKTELAQRAGLTLPTIDRIEKGYDCHAKTKRKILGALGITIENRHKIFNGPLSLWTGFTSNLFG